MRIFYNSSIFKLPWMNNFSAVVVGRFMFTKYERVTLPYLTYYHETIHQYQMDYDGIILFYIKYAGFFVTNLLAGMSPMKAYYAIPYEKEAYGLTAERERQIIKGRENISGWKDIL